MEKPLYKSHISNAESLITSYKQTRTGFVTLALERNRRATPSIEQARALKSLAMQTNTPSDLADIPAIQSGLLTAAGVSDKAAAHFEEADKRRAIENLVKNFLEPAGRDFIEELVFRFLLTKGDSLGGSMRNVGGILAQRKFARGVLSSLLISGIRYLWLDAKSRKWIKQSKEDADIELSLRGLSWQQGKSARTLLSNFTVPIVKNNIDICLLTCSATEYSPEIVQTANSYLALGELKGGIDPAGADEHWKTARSALERIRTSFKSRNCEPKLFFVGAAIERKMATEIWSMLENTTLTNAANLTDEHQAASLCSWLVSL